MKKVIFMILTVFVMLLTISFSAFAASEHIVEAYVTISNNNGSFILVREKVILKDIDDDGELTINDALYIAHENNYKGGAKEGYSFSLTEYGLSLNKLWGDTSGAVGYCINDMMAMSLGDEIKSGDHIKTYIYQDKIGYSDKYAYFNKISVKINKGEEISLVLNYIDYDENWNPVIKQLSEAIIFIDNKETEYKTDINGKITIALEGKGTVNISAKSNELILVPPICQVEINDKNNDQEITDNDTENGNSKTNVAVIIACSVVALIVLGGLVGTQIIKAKNKNEE